jgi:hypothetical protein
VIHQLSRQIYEVSTKEAVICHFHCGDKWLQIFCLGFSLFSSTSAAMAEPQPAMRKTRFVCISDTHNATPNGAFKLPKGDVLIHAGDMTNQGSLSELKKTIKWMEEADFEAKIVIAGKLRKMSLKSVG